jgi:hypothetical protein
LLLGTFLGTHHVGSRSIFQALCSGAGRRDFDSVVRNSDAERVEAKSLRGVMKSMVWGCRLAALGILSGTLFGVLAWSSTSVPAHAQNLDEGKSGAKLFADSCASCHHSPRGLAKGRFRLTLYFFLQDHYSSSSNSASELASYLVAVDDAPSGQPHGKAKKRPTSTSTSRSSLTPPAPIPQR